MKLLNFAFLLFFLCIQNAKSKPSKVVCYYESWASDFTPDDIDITTCTHINYAFMGIEPDGSLRLDGSDSVIKKLVALKKKNSSLKVLLSVGGWSEGSTKFSQVAGNAAARSKLAQVAFDYMQKYNLDGLDIDWEYPTQRGGKAADKKNFITLLQTIKQKFQPNGYLLSAAVISSAIPSWYDIQQMDKILDFISVMTYDYHQAGDGRTGQNSPLYPSHVDGDKSLNVDASIRSWFEKGPASPSKLLLGLGFYGHSFTLADPKNHGIGAKTVGAGQDGGFMSYADICKANWTEVWDDEQKVPYAYHGNQWVGYDNPRSIDLKVKYVRDNYLGGVLIWAIDLDDKHGACGTPFGLIKAVKNG